MKGGLGNMPLTLFVIVAGIILFLYIRRAHLGIDTHPGERVQVKPRAPSVFIGPIAPDRPFSLPGGGGGPIEGPIGSSSGGGGSIQ